MTLRTLLAQSVASCSGRMSMSLEYSLQFVRQVSKARSEKAPATPGSRLPPKTAPKREEIIQRMEGQWKQRHQIGAGAPRKGWQVNAASWVKKMHVDREDVKVGIQQASRFVVVDDMKPRYVVPDLSGFLLKPYVSHFEKNEESSKSVDDDSKDPGPR
eukprot:gene16934-23206_t